MVYFPPTPPHPAYDRLMAAIDGEQPSTVEAAFANGANPNWFPTDRASLRWEDDMSPLDSAVIGGKLDVIRVLLKRGADPNLGDGFCVCPLEAAAENDSLEVMRLLIKNGAKVNDNSEGSSALWRAAFDAHLAALAFLLQHGANPNTFRSTLGGKTLLKVLSEDAALGDNPPNAQVVRMLKAAGGHE